MSAGAKIIAGLEEAVRGDFAAVYIEGQTWRRVDWQPIETAPKDGTEILACWDAPDSGFRARGILFWAEYNSEWLTVPGRWVKLPTHWQPLPAPPQGASQ